MTGSEADGDPRRRAKGLEDIARTFFPDLKTAEIKFLLAAHEGQTKYCGPSERSDDPENDPRKDSAKWPQNRWICAELIRWVATSQEAASRVDLRGISIHAATIHAGCCC